MTFTEKLMTAPGPVEIAGRQVKRYHISSAAEIEEPVQAAAREILPSLLPRQTARRRPRRS